MFFTTFQGVSVPCACACEHRSANFFKIRACLQTRCVAYLRCQAGLASLCITQMGSPLPESHIRRTKADGARMCHRASRQNKGLRARQCNRTKQDGNCVPHYQEHCRCEHECRHEVRLYVSSGTPLITTDEDMIVPSAGGLQEPGSERYEIQNPAECRDECSKKSETRRRRHDGRPRHVCCLCVPLPVCVCASGRAIV